MGVWIGDGNLGYVRMCECANVRMLLPDRFFHFRNFTNHANLVRANASAHLHIRTFAHPAHPTHPAHLPPSVTPPKTKMPLPGTFLSAK